MINKSIRDAYGEALKKYGKENLDVVVLDADVSGSTKSGIFGKEFPERYFNVGIAEQNMMAMAAGLSTDGKIPFANTFAAFIILRCADPIRSLIAYTNLNVKIGGAYAGMSDSYDGATHHALCDLAFMRAMPNMTVISPCDGYATDAATKYVIDHKGPVYLRLHRGALDFVYDENTTFTFGKGTQLTDGSDVAIVATGYMVQKSLAAAKLLEKDGISARVIDLHTIKPIDREILVLAAKDCGCVVTAEEHSVIGGLGSAVAETLTRECPVPMEFVGTEDTFAESGDYEALLAKYGLSPDNIAAKAKLAIAKKK